MFVHETKSQLEELLIAHHQKDIQGEDGNLFVEIVFPWQGDTSENPIQYQLGTVNFACLDAEQELLDVATEIFERHDIEYENFDDVALTGRREDLGPDEALTIIEEGLTRIYRTEWGEVTEIREVDL